MSNNCSYTQVTWYDACALATNAVSMVTYWRCHK